MATPQDLFAVHYQFNGDSAHEFIMKLHDEIGLNDFPLQSDPANEGGGYTFNAFLQKYGFSGADKKPASGWGW